MAYMFKIKPFQAYHSHHNGMDHYYFQHPEWVIHVNTHGPLINKLDVEHILICQGEQVFEEIPTDTYLAITGEVLGELGFDFYPTLPLTQTRLN